MSKARNYCKVVETREIRLKNRRVRGRLHPNGDITWVFKKLEDGVPVHKYLRLSREAICAMYSITLDFIRLERSRKG